MDSSGERKAGRRQAPTGLGRACLWTACAAGLLHAGFSFYWALGGRWLLDTVGQWAVQESTEAPLRTGVLLGAVAAFKAAAALIPAAAAYGRVPKPGLWRTLSWIGAVVLVLYGGANTVVSNAVLAGLIRPDTGYDRMATIGHAWLWDPLFLLWGGALLGYLVLSRTGLDNPRERAR
ncbi:MULTISPECIES: DUF3995 domain-containing protein [unclassified Arthrobacter]|uniref:DUF3995 domain-containing protein n=1 Tax=unclassified Arthrobacter TaxID=235627 RepID=UPI002106FAB0|nr:MULTISPECIES: DUF3995 domain-containing protein [unclassified Arthrobacter]MCQ1946026.1 DUF3995 domain-containing protein [Arthrobacter sp. zg-Y1116]MCQ1985964.1 DUF3995 domain-containing protein [Arthrobacter sp. zg-Y844]